MTSPSSPEAPLTAPAAPTAWPPGTLLAALPSGCRAEFLRLGVPRRYAQGEVLMREGEPAAYAALLVRGFVKVTTALENGRVALLGIRVGGDSVGEMAALDETARSATVTACGGLTLRVIPRVDFRTFLCRHPEAGLAVTSMISERLRWSNRRRTDFSGYPAGVRLARILVDLARAYGRRTEAGICLGIELTQLELGALAGADADTAGRELRKLRTHQVISTGYRRTIVRDLTALEGFARLTGDRADRRAGR